MEGQKDLRDPTLEKTNYWVITSADSPNISMHFMCLDAYITAVLGNATERGEKHLLAGAHDCLRHLCEQLHPCPSESPSWTLKEPRDIILQHQQMPLLISISKFQEDSDLELLSDS